MDDKEQINVLKWLKKKYPQKFLSEEEIFKRIRRGDRIFIGTGCGQPQNLVKKLVHYVQKHPKALFDTEIIQVWTLGVAPYLDEKFKHNFRLNSFFIGNSIREVINKGTADYTPIFLSEVPNLFRRGIIPIDVALIQTSLPDRHGLLSLGISVDIVKSAIENASLVIAQCNKNIPRVFGDSFLNIKDVDFIVSYDEPLLSIDPDKPDKIAQKIGKYVARIVEDGDTIQVGYGKMRNHILASLVNKKHLGVHTELLSDGFIELMKKGVVDNSKKTIDRGKTVAAFCMGQKETYDYLHNNPKIEFKTIDYTNNPLIISKIKNMTAINTALEMDLTGQATSESIGAMFFSGIGGFADFMRGAVLAHGGKTILTLPSSAKDGTISRIVPQLSHGAGVTFTRGDVYYVVTEYGIAYLHGKNIRERAMSLISIAHPKFRPWLVEEAKKLHLIYGDQKFIPGKSGKYPEDLETYRTTKNDRYIFLRPVKMDDEPLLKDFFYALSDKNMYRRFASARFDITHEQLQKFVIIDYTKEIVILAMIERKGLEIIIGMGQYCINKDSYTAEVAFAVRDEYQNRGIGTEIITYLAYLAKKQGLSGFTAQVLGINEPALHLIEKLGFNIESQLKNGVYDMRINFNDPRWGFRDEDFDIF